MRPLLRFDVIGDAWRLYQRRWWTWSAAMLIVLIAYSMAGTALFAAFGERWPGGSGGFRLPAGVHVNVLHSIGTVVVGGFFLGGMIRMASRQVLGHDPRIEDLFSVVDVGFNLITGAVLYGLATALGGLFCVIPGFIVSGLLMFALPLIVIARRPATEAVAESWNILSSQWLTATVLNVVLGFVSGLGFLFFGVGLLVTGPLYSLSIAILFHEFYEPMSTPHAKKPPPDAFRDF